MTCVMPRTLRLAVAVALLRLGASCGPACSTSSDSLSLLQVHAEPDSEAPEPEAAYPDSAFEEFRLALRSRVEAGSSETFSEAAAAAGAPGKEDLHLVVSLFIPQAPTARDQYALSHIRELHAAFSTNLLNPWITHVHVLLEAPHQDCSVISELVQEATGRKPNDLSKVVCAKVARQPTYADFLDYANRTVQDGIVMIANGDVVFDDTLRRMEDLRPGRDAYIVSVRPPPYEGEFKKIFGKTCKRFGPLRRCAEGTNSWDAFVFRTPLPGGLMKLGLNFTMNLDGAEHHAAWALNAVGFNLKNPCLHLAAYHWHCFGKKMHSSWDEEGQGAGNRPRGWYGISTPCTDYPEDTCVKRNYIIK